MKKIIVLFIVCAMFIAFTPSANAYTMTDLYKQLETLKTQVTGLQQNLSALALSALKVSAPVVAPVKTIAPTTVVPHVIIPTTGPTIRPTITAPTPVVSQITSMVNIPQNTKVTKIRMNSFVNNINKIFPQSSFSDGQCTKPKDGTTTNNKECVQVVWGYPDCYIVTYDDNDNVISVDPGSLQVVPNVGAGCIGQSSQVWSWF